MNVFHSRVRVRSGAAIAGLMLVTGIVADNALSATVAHSTAIWLFPVVCGLMIGSLTVLTYMRYTLAYAAGAALHSAFAVIALTANVPHRERVIVLVLSAITVVACMIGADQVSAPMRMRIGTRHGRS